MVIIYLFHVNHSIFTNARPFFSSVILKKDIFFCKQMRTEIFVELKMSFEMTNHTAWWLTQHYSRFFFFNWNGRNGIARISLKIIQPKLGMFLVESMHFAIHLTVIIRMSYAFLHYHRLWFTTISLMVCTNDWGKKTEVTMRSHFNLPICNCCVFLSFSKCICQLYRFHFE